MKNIFSYFILIVVATLFVFTSMAFAKDKVVLGFLVKQAEEPWFQTEWRFAQKVADEKGIELIKIAVPDGEKTLTAIDTLAAKSAKGFVICAPDVRLGPAIIARAKYFGMKVVTVDDRFIDSKGEPMAEVPYLGLDASAIGRKMGSSAFDEAKKRNWKLEDTGVIVNTYDELDTIHQRTEGGIEALKSKGIKEEQIFETPLRALDQPSSFDSTNYILTAHRDIKYWIVIGGNDSSVLGGIRATENAGFSATDIIGVGINGTDVKEEFKKDKRTGMFGSILPRPDLHGSVTTEMLYKWVKDDIKPKLFTPIKEATLITKDNFKEELERMGLW